MGRLPFPAHNLAPEVVPADRVPQPRPAAGPFAPNTALCGATRLFEGRVVGSESVAVAPDGTLWMLDKWGVAHTAEALEGAAGGAGDSADSGAEGVVSGAGALRYRLHPQPAAYVGPGRPLGFHFDAAGNLAICDSLKGLMLLERASGGGASSSGGITDEAGAPRWRLRCLSNWAAGRPITYANDLDIAPDGRIYFTDSSIIPPALNEAPRPWYDTMRSYMLTYLHGGATGRLLCYNPADGSTTQLCNGIWFANGCALASDGSFVAVCETSSMRVRRYWLTGPKAGTLDPVPLIDRLPGWPDNICQAGDGNFWLCLVLPDMPAARKILGIPWLRSLMASVPERLQPAKPQWGCVCKVSPEGEVLQVLMDPTGGHVSHVSAVTEHRGRLFLGNLAKDYVSVLDLTAVQAAGADVAAAAAATDVQ
ncbi:strictosidine synthase [Micractinium conductrix]|uniref:Strictosidine synthase n=1 Tax=Micractinium conductrix TaxID=554055 RepID=A0A2P6VMB2_9CHLO|nr:strictosidine synthase [Micractinium conductrix]|eukprot:PSC75234.1 strictosidine synthase [Micractinium conductrix]